MIEFRSLGRTAYIVMVQLIHSHTALAGSIYKENWNDTTGWPISNWTIFKNGCGIQMSQATPIKFSMLFKHNYGQLF